MSDDESSVHAGEKTWELGRVLWVESDGETNYRKLSCVVLCYEQVTKEDCEHVTSADCEQVKSDDREQAKSDDREQAAIEE